MRLPLIKKIFFFLIAVSLFSVLALYRELSFPYITTKVLSFRVIILMALPVYLFLAVAQKDLRPAFKNPISAVITVFLAVSIISAVLGVNLNRSLWGNFERMGGVWHLFHLSLLYFYLEMLGKISGIKFQQALKILAVLGVAASFYGILTKIGFPDGLYPDDALPSRVSSFFGNPIFFASFLIFPTFLAAFFAKQAEQGSNSRKFWLMAIFINLIGIYLSATRGALLGLMGGMALGFLLWSLLHQDRKKRLYGLGAIAAGLAVFLILIAASKAFPQDSILRRLTDFGDSNTRARIIQWSAGLKGFKENPVLGVGPENYYIIGNKYFNPEIYHYDRSWFDKPHNYPLEVLLTTGLTGFLAYLSITLFSLYAAYRAYKSTLLSRLEFSILTAAVLAYQIQNLFVFDTPSASISFFAFTAFMGFLWQASGPASDQKKEKLKPAPSGFAEYGSVAVLILAIYGVYLTNFLPSRAMADLNNGVAAGLKDPVVAKASFDTAMQDEMNFDYNESATKYEEFASEFSLFYQDKKDRPAVIEAVRGALSAVEKAIQRVDNDPILWFKLTNLKATLAHLTESAYDEQIELSAKRGVDLAPQRVEPRYFLVQAFQLKKDFPAAIAEQYNIIKIDFNNPFNFWRLALVYREAKDMPRAYQLALYARQNGYEFRNLAEAQWLAVYYSDLNQFKELAKIYEELIKNNLADIQTRANLALVYAKMGEKEKARAMALKVLELGPNTKGDVEAFLKKLDSGESF